MTSVLSSSLHSILLPYKEQVEELIHAYIQKLGSRDKLHEACAYALSDGGKRFRPALVLMIARSLGAPVDAAQAALAVEFFHTASLVADDLPCMDDDDERRCKPALHKVYGEALALLVSYALIAAGYECLATNAYQIKHSTLPFASRADTICALALTNATFNTGLEGATGGQFLDLNPPNLTLAALREVIHKKTASLFEVAFVLGWLYGGGAIELLDNVKKAACHFGMAFQIADDLGDQEQDAATGRLVNIANVLGREQALEMFHEEMEGYRSALKELPIDGSDLEQIAALLEQSV